ncbi:hypothetical protein [Ectopseudomonas mendocina]|uniref:Tetratricopeptide repeat protein n=1 Tax=Ectopseudomonas mendocina TaxID=300 RepID=A0A2R3QQW7_ECTME|nr:hypothetical protein [Pseudomonas mendocina]AVO54118.1 hypothetical protein C7A17_15530 [Pseudomonas mendocina]
MPAFQVLCTMLLATLLTLSAQAAEKDCSENALRRPLVDTLVSRGDYADAIARLEQVQRQQDACLYDTLDANWYWLRSDLSLAYLKVGREQDCLVLLGRLIDNPASPWDIQQHLEQDDRLQHALRTNQRLCHAAHEKRLSSYSATPCPQPAEGAITSIATVSGSCLVLLPAPTAQSCPHIEEWRAGHPLRQLVPAAGDNDSPLADASRCCSIQTLSVNSEGDQQHLRLQGEGRDCYGGSAYDLIDALYLLHDDQLVLEQDYSRTR